MHTPILVIGAGLTGLTQALYLAHLGYQVEVYEKRPEPVSDYSPSNRSMSMDLSYRGLDALKDIGLSEQLLQHSVPMQKRVIHMPDEHPIHLKYSVKHGEHIESIAREKIYSALLDAVSQHPNINIYFCHEFNGYAAEAGLVAMMDHASGNIKNIPAAFVFGCDGVNSAVRKYIVENTEQSFDEEVFPYRYKELYIPKEFAATLEFHAMHMWPAKGAMLVAQPNDDGSFSCCFLLSDQHEFNFDRCSDDEYVECFLKYFEKTFPNVANCMPDLANKLKNNTVGKLKTMNAGGWNYAGKFLLLGDAAHAMTPFFGQGLNAALEDCKIFCGMLDKFNHDFAKAAAFFESFRKPDTNAITQMSRDNYIDLLCPDWAAFLQCREIELQLMRYFSGIYTSYHNLVCFTNTRYSEIQAVKNSQTALIQLLFYIFSKYKQHNLSSAMTKYANIVHQQLASS